jgi:hypothetical protein
MEAAAGSKRIKRRVRGMISVLMLTAALVLAVRLLLPDTVGEHARRTALELLSENYPDIKITIGSGRYDPNLGFILGKIEFRARHAGNDELPLLTIDRLLIESHIDLTAYRAGAKLIQADRMRVSGATLNVWQIDELSWSPELLLPLPNVGPGCPLIIADGVRVRICQSPDVNRPAIEFRDLSCFVKSDISPDGDKTQKFQARATGGFLESLTVQGETKADGSHQFRGNLKSVNFDNRLFQRLPLNLKSKLADIAGAIAVADVDWQVNGSREKFIENWLAKVQIREARFTHPKLPTPIEKISGSLSIAPRGIKVSNAQFELGDSPCRASGLIHGLAWPCRIDLDVEAKNFELTESILSMFPNKGPELNKRVEPRGRIDLIASLKYDGNDWDADATIRCNNLSVSLEKFPYPITKVNGVVIFKDRITTTTDLNCHVGESLLVTSFQLSPETSVVPHWINIQSRQPLRIDDTLISAMTPRGEPTGKLEKFVRSLAPGGSIQLLNARLARNEEGELSKEIDLEILDGRLRYQAFPYPLYEVRGRIWVDDNQVRISHFQAQNNGGAQIQCEGTWLPMPNQPGGHLDLTFDAYSIPLDDGLRTALPTTARQTWDTLSPSGILERLEVNVIHNPTLPEPQLTITAEQWGNPTLSQRELSVTPTALPYRLDITRGRVRMDGKRILISDLDGYHGTSRLAAEGQCLQREDGRWQLDLNVLTGSRLRPDNELIGALPDEIRGSFAKLQLREPVSLRGTTQLILPNLEYPQPIFNWNVLLQLEGNRIGDLGPVHDIRGEISVRGSASGEDASADGTVNIDSMHIYDLQVTDIQGPFHIRDTTLQLGSINGVTNPIRGQLFGGEIQLTGDVLLSPGDYDVDFTLHRANVATLLNEMNHPQAGLAGLFGGRVRLEGNLGASNLIRGVGKAALSKANIYQLPLIIQIFNQLRLTPAEDVAVDGDLLTLMNLTLWGDLVALQGGGSINSRREVDLTFNTRVSPQNVWSRLVQPLSSSKYALWTIYVRGPLGDPKIERRALDAVGETLERMFPGMERRSLASPLVTGTDEDVKFNERYDASARSGGSSWTR